MCSRWNFSAKKPLKRQHRVGHHDRKYGQGRLTPDEVNDNQRKKTGETNGLNIALQHEFLGRSAVRKQVCIQFEIFEVVERAHHQHHKEGRYNASERGAIKHHLGACRVKGIQHLCGSTLTPTSRFGRDKSRRI